MFDEFGLHSYEEKNCKQSLLPCLLQPNAAYRMSLWQHLTLKVERPRLAVKALDLSNSIKTLSKRQFIEHVDA
jgi:hypothetical protein